MLCVKFGLVSYNEPCMMLSPKDMENVFPQFFYCVGSSNNIMKPDDTSFLDIKTLCSKKKQLGLPYQKFLG